MIISGLIVGTISFLTAAIAGPYIPCCLQFLTVFLGNGAGFLTGVINRPSEQGDTLRRGAIAGVIAGLGMMLGLFFGEIFINVIMGPELATAAKNIGHQPGDFAYEANYWVVIFSRSLSEGLINLVLMTGFSVTGALIWGKLVRDKKAAESTPPMEE
jgi:hypothetical protein